MPKLTKRIIESVVPTERDQYLWDSAIPGFGVRIWPSGRRSYIVQYRTKDRRQRKRTLGQHGILTVEQARQMARQWLADVLQGHDPALVMEAMRTAPTVVDLAQRFMAEHAEIKKKAHSLRSDEYCLRMHVLPAFGRHQVTAITRADITELHFTLREIPYAANRVLSVLSKMFNLAEQWGWRPDGSNPVRHVERYKEKARERFLSPAELGRLSDVLAEAERTQRESPSTIAAIRLLIFTGARLSEILTLRWDYVDFENTCVHLPDSKTGPRTVYLSPPALDVLCGIPRQEDNPHVLTGQMPGRPLGDLYKPWYRIRAKAGLEDVRLHDLRHSFASFGAGLGVSLPIIGKMLGHTQLSTTQRYAHLAADPVREAADKIGELISAALKRSEDENPRVCGSITPIYIFFFN